HPRSSVARRIGAPQSHVFLFILASPVLAARLPLRLQVMCPCWPPPLDWTFGGLRSDTWTTSSCLHIDGTNYRVNSLRGVRTPRRHSGCSGNPPPVSEGAMFEGCARRARLNMRGTRVALAVAHDPHRSVRADSKCAHVGRRPGGRQGHAPQRSHPP